MKIAVAYKWAPNPQDATVAGDGTVDWSRAKSSVSEYDQVAVELGRRLADETGAELVGISVGPVDVGSAMARKTALSRGLDRLVLVSDEMLTAAGPTRTAAVLAQVVDMVGDVDLVLTGDSSQDLGAQLVPASLAGTLGWPALSNVTSVVATADGLTVERAQDGGTQTLHVTGPVVLAVAGDAAVPRVPGMKDILAAGKRPTDVLDIPVPAPEPVTVLSTSPPALKARKGQVIDGTDPAAAAATLVAALRTDNVL